MVARPISSNTGRDGGVGGCSLTPLVIAVVVRLESAAAGNGRTTE